MELMKYISGVIFILIVTSFPVAASGDNCSYSKSVRLGKTAFDIRSIPVSGCAVQIVSVAVRNGGKKVSGMKADVDYLARSAKAVDLTGDGTPELAIFSRTIEAVETEALDIYWLDGTTLRRTTVPELEGIIGYKGGDRFQFNGRLIVRTTPVYRYGDPVGEPTGGTRSFEYDFKEGKIALLVESVQRAEPAKLAEPAKHVELAKAVEPAKIVEPVQPAEPAKPVESAKAVEPVKPVEPLPIETRSVAQSAVCRLVTEIAASDAGIEVRTCAPIDKFKVLKLEKPGRIVVDLPDVDSSLAGKTILVNRFGIDRVRVGRSKGFLRIVLDSTLGKPPEYEVKSSGTGILIELVQPVQSAQPVQPVQSVQSVQPVQPVQPVQSVQSVQPLPVETKSVEPTGRAVTAITASDVGIEIKAGGPIEKFKVMKLANPERITIDIPDADSPLARQMISMNRFGISKVRVGRNKGFLRVVLDTNLRTFPKYRVISSPGGVLVEFTQ